MDTETLLTVVIGFLIVSLCMSWYAVYKSGGKGEKGPAGPTGPTGRSGTSVVSFTGELTVGKLCFPNDLCIDIGDPEVHANVLRISNKDDHSRPIFLHSRATGENSHSSIGLTKGGNSSSIGWIGLDAANTVYAW